MIQKTELLVQGMTCASCIRHVSAALSELAGVERVDVRLREGRAVVNHDPAIASVASLLEALREAGYESSASVAA